VRHAQRSTERPLSGSSTLPPTASPSHAELIAHHYTEALALARAADEKDEAAALEEPARSFLELAGDRALKLDVAKADAWISNGAQPTSAVKKLIKIARAQACFPSITSATPTNAAAAAAGTVRVKDAELPGPRLGPRGVRTPSVTSCWSTRVSAH